MSLPLGPVDLLTLSGNYVYNNVRKVNVTRCGVALRDAAISIVHAVSSDVVNPSASALVKLQSRASDSSYRVGLHNRAAGGTQADAAVSAVNGVGGDLHGSAWIKQVDSSRIAAHGISRDRAGLAEGKNYPIAVRAVHGISLDGKWQRATRFREDTPRCCYAAATVACPFAASLRRMIGKLRGFVLALRCSPALYWRVSTFRDSSRSVSAGFPSAASLNFRQFARRGSVGPQGTGSY